MAADKAYDTRDFVQTVRAMQVTPHVSQNLKRSGGGAIDARTTTPLGLALRGRFLVGSHPVDADFVRRFIASAAQNGIQPNGTLFVVGLMSSDSRMRSLTTGSGPFWPPSSHSVCAFS